jgi:chlorobactene glucosyltransferase
VWLLGASLVFSGLVGLSLFRILQQFRCYETLYASIPWGAPSLPTLAVIVPARNEGHNIASCLEGLIRQDYPKDKIRCIVVNDHSSDDTAGIVRRIGATTDRHVELIAAAALPENWAGKPHACWYGALTTDAEWLCFADADTIAEPELMRSAVVTAERQNLAMISLEPFQELSGFLDRLVIPVGFLAIAATRDLARVNAPGFGDATANGQFILIKASCYFAVGGHAAICGAICEDAALALRVKKAGFRIAVLGAETLIRTRMYRNAGDLWEGLSKNVTEIYGGLARTLATALGAVFIGWSALLLPPAALMASVDLRFSTLLALCLATLASIAVFATSIALARHLKIRWWFGLFFPLSAVLAAIIAANGVFWRVRGRVIWKGRAYSP